MLGGEFSIPPPMMMDMTVREIDAYAQGADQAQRGAMAMALWSAHNAASFNSYAFAGKRLPNIEQRLGQMINGTKSSPDLSLAIAEMRNIARRNNLPPPKPRRI